MKWLGWAIMCFGAAGLLRPDRDRKRIFQALPGIVVTAVFGIALVGLADTRKAWRYPWDVIAGVVAMLALGSVISMVGAQPWRGVNCHRVQPQSV